MLFKNLQNLFCRYYFTTTMYCNTNTNKLNVVHNIKVCKEAVEEHQTIGGQGVVVEIDETHLTSKAKYNVGRDVVREHMWAFGGIERYTGRRFCVSLGLGGSRNMPNLEPLIIKHIKKGSIIMSDCWGAYRNINSLVDANGASMNYCHYAVNHSISFVNPENRWVHTQTVERFWGDLKDHISGRGKGLRIEQNVYRYYF